MATSKKKLSKSELQTYLKLDPEKLQKLTDAKVYKIVEATVTEMVSLETRLTELKDTFKLLQETKLSSLFETYETNVIQFRTVFVAQLKQERTNWKRVVDQLVKQRPDLSNMVDQLASEQKTTVTQLRKAVGDVRPKGFPKPKTTLKRFGETEVEAGVVEWLKSLWSKAKGAVQEAWQALRGKVVPRWERLISNHMSKLAHITKEVGTMKIATYKIVLNPSPTVPLREVTAHVYGGTIQEVKVLGPSLVEITTSKGVAQGSKDDLLPPPLLQLMAPIFKAHQLSQADGTNDHTYDSDSTVNPRCKPNKKNLHSRELAIRRVFSDLPDEESDRNVEERVLGK